MLPMPIFDWYFLPWLVTPLIIFLIYIIKNFRRESLPLLFYLFAYPLYVAFNQQYGVQDYAFTLHLKYFALGSLVPLLMVNYISAWPKYLSLFLGAISIIQPVCGNFSLTACLMLAFMAVHGFNWIFVVAILVHPTALGIGGLFFMWAWSRFGAWTLLSFVALPLGSYFDFFSNSGRFHMWGNVWKHFWGHQRKWFGYGPGSFTQYGAHITDAVDIANILRTYFIFAHNEALQFLFEFGIVGWLTLLPVLWVLRKEKWFPVFCFISFFNWPFRSAVFSMFMCYTIFLALRKKQPLHWGF